MLIPSGLLPYLKYLPTFALLFGFIFDIFTLDRPDAVFENVVIVGYLTLAAGTILVLQARGSVMHETRRLLLLSTLQFAFGNLASGLLVLYARSGTFAGTAIFLGILVLLLIGNELLKTRYARTHLRLVIWFILALTYATLIVPVILNSIGTMVFLVSIASALGAAIILIFLVSRVGTVSFKNITTSVLGVTIVFATLYAAHLIPPVPLALKHIGIYHDVVRDGDVYNVTYEQPKWHEFWQDTARIYNHTPGEPVFCFSSIFAPADLQTEIRHRWEKYHTDTEEWVTHSRIPFPILGGRADGYRGYTRITLVDDGTWRCTVETSRGVIIGRTTFDISFEEPILNEGAL